MAKRALDLVVSTVLLVALAPLLAAMALWVRADSPGGAIFRQQRVGRGGRPFAMWKFRTMRADAERAGPQVTVGRDPRVTRAGRFLRATRLDELPQLVNVLRGDMSLVGPRPEVPRYVAAYPPAIAAEVLSVRPGVTEASTLAWRDEASLLAAAPDPERYYVEQLLPRKLEAQREYVRSRSFLGDCAILLRTAAAVIPSRPSPPPSTPRA